jgi:hypothetical protein
LLGGMALTAGCGTTKKAADNPVVGPRPPRISDQMLAQLDGPSAGTSAPKTDGVIPVSGEDTTQLVREAVLEETSAREGVGLNDADVVARVNGSPIFVSEVLERFRPQLEGQRAKVSPAQYQQMRLQVLNQELSGHIEQALVLDAARAQFKQEQWDQLQEKLDEFFFEDEVPSLQKRLKAASQQDLDGKLRTAGTSLSSYRRVWGERQIAGQWVSDKIPEVSVSRQELLDEYTQKRDSYRQPEQVKWQECLILDDKSGGREGAKKRVQQAIADLKAGKSFDQIVAAHSDGARAADGGHWDWTQPTSLADQKLVGVLTTIKLDQIGPVLEDERGYRLVKLTGYRPESVTPFEEVQKELREAVSQRKREAAAQKVIADLKTKAHVEILVDGVTWTG